MKRCLKNGCKSMNVRILRPFLHEKKARGNLGLTCIGRWPHGHGQSCITFIPRHHCRGSLLKLSFFIHSIFTARVVPPHLPAQIYAAGTEQPAKGIIDKFPHLSCSPDDNLSTAQSSLSPIRNAYISDRLCVTITARALPSSVILRLFGRALPVTLHIIKGKRKIPYISRS